MESALALFNRIFSPIGAPLIRLTQTLGEFIFFVGKAFGWLFRPPFRFSLFLKQMEFIGVKSIWIVMLVGAFSGGVFALQTHSAFALFNAESLVGATVGISLARELAPVFTGLMVIARAGSAIAAELGTMKVTEQVDALTVMAVNPIQYLVVPRMVAGFFMLPLLTGIFNAIGILGSYVVGVQLLNIPEGPFRTQLETILDPSDIVQGLIKAAIFGFFLVALATFQGLRTTGGAEGVGRSTTRAVVLSSVTILILDYFLSSWILEYFPKF